MEQSASGKMKGNKLRKILRSLSQSGRTMSSSKLSPSTPFALISKSKSWPRSATPPEGCFSVYVGAQRERFVVKTEYTNHHLFKMLLEEAEMEYGYSSEGPLALPCEVDLFHRVLREMEDEEIRQGCHFKRSYTTYRLLSPSRV